MKLLCVINPVSGDKDKRYFVNNINDYCFTYGIGLNIFYTAGGDDRSEIAALIRSEKPDRVVSVGGDGTFSMLVDVLMGTDIPLCYVPFGSANGMKGDINLADTPWDFFKIAMRTFSTQELDIVSVNGHNSIHVADMGVNAQLVKNYSNNKAHGLFSYAKYLFNALSSQEQYKFTVIANGHEYQREGSMLIIANGTRYGTGLIFNPGGNPFDRKFEVIIIKSINIFTLLRAGFPSAQDKSVFRISTDRARIGISRVTTLQVDGEVGGRYDTLEISISPQTVRIVMPNLDGKLLDEDYDQDEVRGATHSKLFARHP